MGLVERHHFTASVSSSLGTRCSTSTERKLSESVYTKTSCESGTCRMSLLIVSRVRCDRIKIRTHTTHLSPQVGDRSSSMFVTSFYFAIINTASQINKGMRTYDSSTTHGRSADILPPKRSLRCLVDIVKYGSQQESVTADARDAAQLSRPWSQIPF